MGVNTIILSYNINSNKKVLGVTINKIDKEGDKVCFLIIIRSGQVDLTVRD